MKVHIIYTASGMFLSKKPYASWREIQDGFDGYRASIGPWTGTQVVEFLAAEYPDLQPSPEAHVEALLVDPEPVRKL